MKLVKQRKVIKWRSRMLVAWVAIRWERSGCRPLVLTLANQPACGVKKKSFILRVHQRNCQFFATHSQKLTIAFFFQLRNTPEVFVGFVKMKKWGGYSFTSTYFRVNLRNLSYYMQIYAYFEPLNWRLSFLNRRSTARKLIALAYNIWLHSEVDWGNFIHKQIRYKFRYQPRILSYFYRIAITPRI